jgi:hypothetical protein
MTIQQLETAKKLHDAIKDNERVFDYLSRTRSNPDTINVLFEFFTKCGNLNASIPKDDLAKILFEYLSLTIKTVLDADRKKLEAL